MKPKTLSFLITHYNRPAELKRLTDAVRLMNLPVDYEIVVSDDCSDISVIDEIKSFGVDRIAETPKNGGLGHNINKGLKLCCGDFVLYCQEDWVPVKGFDEKISVFLHLLETHQLEMIRLTAGFRFPYLERISDDVSLIPRLSVKNYLYNHFRYSDNPYIARKDFFDKHGYYLENTSTIYGENEYMVRIMKSDVKVGISTKYYFNHKDLGNSVRDDAPPPVAKKKKTGFGKAVHKHLRALRFFYEYLLYDKEKRGLKTYKNLRRN